MPGLLLVCGGYHCLLCLCRVAAAESSCIWQSGHPTSNRGGLGCRIKRQRQLTSDHVFQELKHSQQLLMYFSAPGPTLHKHGCPATLQAIIVLAINNASHARNALKNIPNKRRQGLYGSLGQRKG
ncbi:hypothetical protein NDU88_003539 [Pleurodeles waltl]|uniref:Secreted protein n=1 Tax=Pleurodeles waltl TaxID=8319 RepID=A0AAV7WTX2_PLEWA|nr:hypothetical protein NDU88_003539 [Pleurodeles waltl]